VLNCYPFLIIQSFILFQIEGAQAAILNEIDDLKNRRYDPTPLLTDMIHAVNYYFYL
jgi:hypothetical protein